MQASARRTSLALLSVIALWVTCAGFAIRAWSQIALAAWTMRAAAASGSFRELLASRSFYFDAAVVFIGVVVVAAAAIGIIRAIVTAWQTVALRRWIGNQRRITSTRLDRLASAARISWPITIIESREWISLTVGFFRPRIVLSTQVLTALSDDELTAILHHESAHAAAYDPLRVALLALLLPFNGISLPLARVYEPMLAEFETAADDETIRRMRTREPLIRALLRFLTVDPPKHHPSVAAFSVTNRRLERLLSATPALPQARPFFSGLFAAIAIIVIASSGLILAQCSRPVRCVIRTASAAETVNEPPMSFNIVGNASLCSTPPLSVPMSASGFSLWKTPR